jgi:hypothetical protein
MGLTDIGSAEWPVSLCLAFGYFKLGQVRLGQVGSGWFRIGEGGSGYVKVGQVGSIWVN